MSRTLPGVTVRSRAGLSRRAAELLVTGVAAVLVAGVLLGTGFAQTVLAATDGLTWLGDDTRGEAIQINPTTGRPEVRLTKIAPPGHPLHVAQTDTLLVITDPTTGQVTIIDPATLATTGTWHGTPERTKILLTTTDLYIVDRATGTITRLDPDTIQLIGPQWRAGAPLADAAIDTTATIWALDTRGTLHQLHWTNADTGLATVNPPRRIAGTGPNSVLVPHDQGITIFAPESGQITQTGTTTGGLTMTARALATDHPLAPAERAPATLVPVTIPAENTLILLTDHATVAAIDTARHNCPDPGPPAVYRDEVYVPCGTGHVIAYHRNGTHLRAIPTGASRRPILVLDEDRLFINTPGEPTPGLYIDTDRTIHHLSPLPENLPPQDPAEPPPLIEPNPVTDERPGSRADNPGDRPRGGPSNDPTGQPSGPPSDGPGDPSTSPIAPTGVTATVTNGQVTVRWQHPGEDIDGFIVGRTNPDTALSGLIGAARRDFIVADLGTCDEVTFVVHAVRGTRTATSTPSQDSRARILLPPTPPSVTIDHAAVTVTGNGTTLTLPVTIGPATARCAPVTGYTITATGTTPRSATVGRNTITTSCGGPCWDQAVTVTATAHTDEAGDSSASDTYDVPSYPGPRIDTITSQPNPDSVTTNCPNGWSQCIRRSFRYDVGLAPPATGRTFDTCTLLVQGSGPLAFPRPISCGATRASLGQGDGSAYGVSVQACDATGCITSPSRTVSTLEPIYIGPMCGDVLC